MENNQWNNFEIVLEQVGHHQDLEQCEEESSNHDACEIHVQYSQHIFYLWILIFDVWDKS